MCRVAVGLPMFCISNGKPRGLVRIFRLCRIYG
ncbi:MAG: hypothetical protein HON53_19110 [Planctomycetaceae bacterium]|nr:hypothetical protein [Planctomycetaceae bacterium]MBT6156654.1 hypothetical protein [Planctomycetaceae bacterium]MBT6486406.1 hypothetical protein [Planctomycetaceae bacterium]MBT6494027.1 hypothetical protein [Planctomycetaceae bacterium]